MDAGAARALAKGRSLLPSGVTGVGGSFAFGDAVAIVHGEREVARGLSNYGSEALLRIRRVGVCGTDIHAFRGEQPFFEYPRILEAISARASSAIGRELVGRLSPSDDLDEIRRALEPVLEAVDLIAFDEACQFLEPVVRFLMGWNRAADKELGGTSRQRVRSVMASNPPISASGDWVIGMFRPWLDITHSNPAEHGELRWFITDPDGKDLEVDGPDDIRTFDHVDYIPRSRTFIPAALSDNPFLVDTGYQATLDAMRSIRSETAAALRSQGPQQRAWPWPSR